ncbi:MAG: FAD-dependent oxidoreductase [Candidatus Tectomicrobia bacterium]|uniref:FAD-dependent oxidoreductase n=1 Tax=Tectimicrobiota bacterium TaxID=2528274 RepID=A0A938B1V0_UNCTE|nr:FAD-dependent oxidoreductase [Candidatus Tectomicrobia bacterium]
MTSQVPQHYYADVVIIGFGAAGSCAAIEAYGAGANVVLLEKQPEATHYSNTRMSGGGFHSPSPDGDFEAIKAYAKAMFSGENLPHKLEGEQPEFSDALAHAWAMYAPQNAAFMRELDPQFQTFSSAGAAFPDFPGADRAQYACLRSTYTGVAYDGSLSAGTKDAPKAMKESGEAFHTCLLTGLQARNIPVHYDTTATAVLTNDDGVVTGVAAVRHGQPVLYHARRAVLITSGGYEYNIRMRKAFLDGPGKEGWAFYGSPANTGDGIRMALKIGAALSKIGSVAGRVICAIPERRLGLKIGLNTSSVGKPHEIVVDNHGQRYAAERRITKDPSRYIFYKEALQFDTVTLSYPRIPSWMIFDTTLMNRGALVSASAAAYNGIDWDQENQNALHNGWIVQGATLADLAAAIRAHPDNRSMMDTATLTHQVETWNRFCAAGHDADFHSEPETMGALHAPPYFAIPLYPGGPNTKGGLRANARRAVLDWDDKPIPRLYAAGEICSVFQFVYQGGGNLAECIVFGRIAGMNAAAETPLEL